MSGLDNGGTNLANNQTNFTAVSATSDFRVVTI